MSSMSALIIFLILSPAIVVADDTNALRPVITQMKSLCSQPLQNQGELNQMRLAMMPIHRILTSQASSDLKKQAWTFMYQYRDCPNAAIRATILRLSRLPFFSPDERQDFYSERLDDPSPEVRETLVEILIDEGLRSTEVEILLNLFSQDSDPRVRQKAQFARQHLHLP